MLSLVGRQLGETSHTAILVRQRNSVRNGATLLQASIRECTSRVVYAGVGILSRMAQSDLLEAAHPVLSHMIGNNC
jgi:hypothetical protein